jgi:transcriptional regulator with XRE-family HTH domain
MDNRLQEIRLSKGLSQSQLAKASGINVRILQYYEQGARDLFEASYSRVVALANALDVSPAEFFINN